MDGEKESHGLLPSSCNYQPLSSCRYQSSTRSLYVRALRLGYLLVKGRCYESHLFLQQSVKPSCRISSKQLHHQAATEQLPSPMAEVFTCFECRTKRMEGIPAGSSSDQGFSGHAPLISVFLNSDHLLHLNVVENRPRGTSHVSRA